VFPSTACILQDKLGIKNRGAAFDMQAVCGGFVYALNTRICTYAAGRPKPRWWSVRKCCRAY